MQHAGLGVASEVASAGCGPAKDDKEQEELAARDAMERAYCPFNGEMLAGCSFRTADGALIGGSSIGTWSGFGTISPVAMAFVALGARGRRAASVTSAAWMATGSSLEVHRLCAADEALLKALAPYASFHHVSSAGGS